MKLQDYTKEHGNNADISGIKLKIPNDVKQLGVEDSPIEEGYIVSLHANGEGLFMSQDPKNSTQRRLIPVYPTQRADILEWEVVL